MEVVRLLGFYRESRATAMRVDRYPAVPLEPKPMAAWNMVKPTMNIFEIGRLEAKRGNHRRDVQMARQVVQCY
jgi:hypothetical protein